jgi:RNA polymerase sigma-70 factor (ECF subfamily)
MVEIEVSVNDLAKACARSSDAAEWGELMRRCAPLTAMVVGRVVRLWMSGSSPAVVDDIVQEVFLKLCDQERRILREFEPRGEDSFLGLLRTISVSVANDHFRRRSSAKRGGNVVTMSIAEDSPSGKADGAIQTENMQQSVLIAQLDKKLRSAPETISGRDRDLFWLYYLQGLTAEEIARVPKVGLTAKGVESALRRVASWLRTEVKKRGPER